ncbi:MAG: glycosyltransferase [Bacteroidaceae bacterium]|nr:glycosyltransferase [Bacteroidaceae bacterium]
MRVLLVNTSERVGGAAIAASRLTDALNCFGIKAIMLVRDIQTQRATTVGLPRTGWRGLHLKWFFLWERLRIFLANRLHTRGLWEVDIACCGADITQLPEFKAADIIHLHWVNQGMLSLHQLARILRSGKPVVWTMHDMWPCTAICHHARTCEHFFIHCHDCPQLVAPRSHDLSWQIYKQKLETYAVGALTFVTCSHWLAEQASRSRLLQGHQIVTIPNTFDSHIFHPADCDEARRHHGLPGQRRLLLFACQKVTNRRKGLELLLQALQQPELQSWQERLALVVVGEMAERMAATLPFPVYPLGYISGEKEMASLYQAVDVFVTPSLEENLPNTIMEAMACGTPCVGFQVGGIPEMIDHEQNGYVARFRDAQDLATGIIYTLDPQNHERLCHAAAEKAVRAWNEATVCRQYIELYDSIVSNRPSPINSKS